MIWVTWRQHRAELFGATLLLIAISAALIIIGASAREAFESDGVASCLSADGRDDIGCSEIINDFEKRYVGISDQLLWLNLAAALIGMFFGAPLLGREFEHGTWRLAWTQSVSRTRWLAVKLALLIPAIAVLAIALSVVVGWWREPLDQLQGRFDPVSFDLAGPSFTASALCAFALGALAGAAIRRTVVAMAVTLVGYVALRIFVEALLRPRYRAPVTETVDPVVHEAGGEGGAVVTQNWVLDTGWVDRNGQPVTGAEQHRLLAEAHDANVDLATFVRDRGIRNFVEYQPAGRWWEFQLIESALFVGIAFMLLVLTVWLVRRRLPAVS